MTNHVATQKIDNFTAVKNNNGHLGLAFSCMHE